jgi:acetyl esterase/lipase
MREPTEVAKGAGRHDMHVEAADSVLRVVSHPAFEGFGQLVLPADGRRLDDGMTLDRIDPLLPYHDHVDPDTTVRVINHMIDEVDHGRTIFYDFYTDQQKREGPDKRSTGLFFLRGEPGAPFAIVCPGGGFAYVGSIHEGFPHALELSRRGHNAFVLKYRVGDGRRATEDLAAALSSVFENAAALGMSTRDYSLWGSSAGARMVASIASAGASAFGGHDLPGPAIIVMAYTGYSTFSVDDPPTFVTVSEDDGIVNVRVVERRVEAMRRAGIEVEYRRYRSAGHGFGLGIGTDAEGWIEYAVRFWERHMGPALLPTGTRTRPPSRTPGPAPATHRPSRGLRQHAVRSSR